MADATVRKTANQSAWHYLGGRLYTAEQLREKDGGSGEFGILLSNMQSNRWERVIHTPKGNWHPWEPEFVYINLMGEVVVP